MIKLNKIKLIFGILSLIICLSCVKSPAEFFEKAEKYNRAGNYIDAILTYNKVITGDDENLKSEAYYKISMIQYVNLNNPQEALKIFEMYLKRFPTAPRADQVLKNMGDVFFKNFLDYNKAIIYYQNLVDNYPKSSLKEEAILNLAKCYFNLENYMQAITEYMKFIDIFPKSDRKVEVEIEIAACYNLLDQQKKAIAMYQEIIKKYTDRPAMIVLAKFSLASIYQDIEKNTEALELYESIKYTYPTPNIVKMKIDKIKLRQNIQGRD